MGNLLATILPWAATALGGPLGGMAATFISNKLGLSDKTEKGIKDFLSGATPEDLQKAKQADQDFQLEMAKLGFRQVYDLEALNVSDRINARDREVKTGDNTTRILAGIYTIGYFIVLYLVFFAEIPKDNTELLNTLIGMLSVTQVGIINYYFGSTKGATERNDALISAVKDKTTGG